MEKKVQQVKPLPKKDPMKQHMPKKMPIQKDGCKTDSKK